MEHFPLRQKPFYMWGFAGNNCEIQLKHVVINESNWSRPWEQPRQTVGSISMERMNLWDWVWFYILWPHTAAFSKQSTIIRSDKRTNTAYSRVKEKHVTLSLSSPFFPHPYVALFFHTFSHFALYLLVISLLLFFSVPPPAALKSLGYIESVHFEQCRPFSSGVTQIFVPLSSSCEAGSMWSWCLF